MKNNVFLKMLIFLIVLVFVFAFSDVFASATTSTYVLQDSYVYDDGEWVSSGGDWLEKWDDYNCYAYAIDRTEDNDRYDLYYGYDPGFFLKSGYHNTMTIDQILDKVISDLETLGMQIYMK